jgi:hypothetical protein
MRKLLVGLLAVALVLCGAFFALVGPRHCPVNRAACERIKEGMTQAEVEAILGGPPGDYRTRPHAPNTFVPFIATSWRTPFFQERWLGDEGTIFVDYHVQDSPGPGKVMEASFEPAEPHNPGLIAIARWRLNRLLEREPD